MSFWKPAWLFGTSAPKSRPSGADTRTQKITIAGTDCEVTAHKTGDAVWKAYGYVGGRPIHASAESPPAAFSLWRTLAKASGDA